MQDKHQISDLMGVTMEKIRDMVDVQTIIGDPITVSDQKYRKRMMLQAEMANMISMSLVT